MWESPSAFSMSLLIREIGRYMLLLVLRVRSASLIANIMKPFQFSMNVGAGVQFDANPHWGLFLHAETGYYFSDGSDIINFYSHAKIPLKIQFGVCVNFYRKNKKNNNNEVQ